MNKPLNFSIFAALIAGSLSCSIAYASLANSSEGESTDVRIYINTQSRSVYQIALLSDISVTELRKLNKGLFDNRDTVNVGERVVLPINSILLADNKKITNVQEDRSSSLPILGSDKNAPINPDANREMETHVANALQTLATQNWRDLNSDKIKQRVQDEARSRAESYARDQVHNQLIAPVQQAAQDLLGKFGTAQVNLSVSDKGSFKGSSLKLFSPWYDSERMLTFSQVSIGDYDGRTIGNFGLGQRWDLANNTLLLGYNAFYDRDFSRGHTRLGLGVEAWADYLKFAANYYSPLSDWKDSKDFDDYLERAARGFDVRVQAYLPSYPHIGGSLIYEQYFGDEVALFGKNNLQKDPRAVSIGIDYTPVPLFTVKGQYKQGQGGKTASVVDLTMNYRMGVPLNEQLDPERVNVARTLKGSRYDMVDRNNNIILEYKQQKPSLTIDFGFSATSERDYFVMKLSGVKIGDPGTYPADYFLYEDRTTSGIRGNRPDKLAPMSLCRETDPNAAYRYTPIILPPGVETPAECTSGNTTPLVSGNLRANKVGVLGLSSGRGGNSGRQIGQWEVLAPPFDVLNNDNFYQFVVEIHDRDGNPVKSEKRDLTIITDRKSVLLSQPPVGVSSRTISDNADSAGANETIVDIKADGKDKYVLNMHLERPTFQGVYNKFNDELPEAMRYQNDLALNKSTRTKPKFQALIKGKQNPSVWWEVTEPDPNDNTKDVHLPENALQFIELEAGAPLPDMTCDPEGKAGGCVRLAVWKNGELGTGLIEDNGILTYSTTITSTRKGKFKVSAAFPPPKDYPTEKHAFSDAFYKPSNIKVLTFDAPPPFDTKMTAIQLRHWNSEKNDWDLVDVEESAITLDSKGVVKVGERYKVFALNAASRQIEPKYLNSVKWVLVGTNTECGAIPAVTISGDSPIELKGADNTSAEIQETMMELTIPSSNDELKSLGAACGVQGFKLKVSVEQN